MMLSGASASAAAAREWRTSSFTPSNMLETSVLRSAALSGIGFDGWDFNRSERSGDLSTPGPSFAVGFCEGALHLNRRFEDLEPEGRAQRHCGDGQEETEQGLALLAEKPAVAGVDGEIEI